MAIAKHHQTAEYNNEVGNNIVDIGVDGAAASTAAAAVVVEVTSEDVIIANGVSGAQTWKAFYCQMQSLDPSNACQHSARLFPNLKGGQSIIEW